MSWSYSRNKTGIRIKGKKIKKGNGEVMYMTDHNSDHLCTLNSINGCLMNCHIQPTIKLLLVYLRAESKTNSDKSDASYHFAELLLVFPQSINLHY